MSRNDRILCGFLVAVAVALSAAVALAQQPPIEKTYTLTLSISKLQTTAKALRRMPFEEVVDILNDIQTQVTAQDAPPKGEPKKSDATGGDEPKKP